MGAIAMGISTSTVANVERLQVQAVETGKHPFSSLSLASVETGKHPFSIFSLVSLETGNFHSLVYL